MGSDLHKKRVLAVSSSGGHWVQLMRFRPAFDGCDVAYMTTEPGCREEVLTYATERSLPTPRFYRTVIANRWNKLAQIRVVFDVLRVIVRERPDVVISTGSSLGFFALRIGKLFSAKTLWIDSIANAEQLSFSGQQILKHADVCLTQWPEVAEGDGQRYKPGDRRPEYWGAVI